MLTGIILLGLVVLFFLTPFGRLGLSKPGPDENRKSEESAAVAADSVVRVPSVRSGSANAGMGGGRGLETPLATWMDPTAACGDCARQDAGSDLSAASGDAWLSQLEGAQQPASRQLGSMIRQMAAGANGSSSGAGDGVGAAGGTGSGGSGGSGRTASDSTQDQPADQPLVDSVLSAVEPAADVLPISEPRGSSDRGSGPKGGDRGDSGPDDDAPPADERRDAPGPGDGPGDGPGASIPSVPPGGGPGSNPVFDPPAPGGTTPGASDRDKVIRDLLDDPIGAPIAGPIAEAPADPISDPFGPPPPTGPAVDDPPVHEVPEPSPLALLGLALFAVAAHRFRHLLAR